MSKARKRPTAGPDDYIVGYARPPADKQFKPGQSGNPRGRPKGSLSLITVLRKALNDRVEVTQNGRVRRISKFELAVTQMVNRAVKGDTRAMQQILVLAPILEADAPTSEQALDGDEQAVLASILGRMRNE